MKKSVSILAATLIFASLLIFPAKASSAAADSLSLCAKLIIPTLFPFFVATQLLSELGLADALGRLLSPVASRLFGVSGKGATAFIVGLSGGYPLGAAYIADMRKKEAVSASEASVLLTFCSNSGPAFIIGAVGIGVFSSSVVGLYLYCIHILSAMVGGIIFGGKSLDRAAVPPADKKPRFLGFAAALTNAVRSSASSILYVCGFVVTFSVFVELICSFGPFEACSTFLSGAFGCELHWGKALFVGLFELGNGVGAMSGLSLSAENLALAAFILGWGGLSVHFQTFALLNDTDIKTARYMIGRLLIALIAAILAYFGAFLIF